jgi:hypothetical protein
MSKEIPLPELALVRRLRLQKAEGGVMADHLMELGVPLQGSYSPEQAAILVKAYFVQRRKELGLDTP